MKLLSRFLLLLFIIVNLNAQNSTSKVELFDINDTTNAITIDWGISNDDKYIVFENLDITANIPWINYIIDNMIKRDDGYLKIPNNREFVDIKEFTVKDNTIVANILLDK